MPARAGSDAGGAGTAKAPSRTDVVLVDAGVLVASVLRTPDSERVAALWEELQRDRVSVFAPRLCSYEVTSVIRGYAFDGLIDDATAEAAVARAFDLAVAETPETPGAHIAALRWAKRLGHRAAYDGVYVAAAEALAAALWTCDRKLARRAAQVGAAWVRAVGGA